MLLRRVLRPVAAGVLVVGLTAFAPPQGDELGALSGITRGQWLLRDDDGSTQKLCVRNPAMLIQLRHPNATCSRVKMPDDTGAVVMRYNCPGHGYGRTRVVVETPRLLRLETSGIADGAPFSSEIEGRYVGECN